MNVVKSKLQWVLWRLKRDVLDVDVEAAFYRRAYAGLRRRAKRTFRLAAVRDTESDQYHLYLTNVPTDRLSAHDVALAYRARWEVELLFRAWKSELRLDELPSRRKPVVEALIYASVITMLVTEQLLAFFRAKLRAHARRVTFGRAAAAVRHFATELLLLIVKPTSFPAQRRLLALIGQEILDPHLHRTHLLQRAGGPSPEPGP